MVVEMRADGTGGIGREGNTLIGDAEEQKEEASFGWNGAGNLVPASRGQTGVPEVPNV